MFMSVHNESGNVNGVALGSKTMNPIEPCADNIRGLAGTGAGEKGKGTMA